LLVPSRWERNGEEEALDRLLILDIYAHGGGANYHGQTLAVGDLI
jgi:hypothetical protein